MGMERILKAACFTPLRKGYWGLPGLFRSIPGAAKTDIVEAFGKKWALHVVTLSPGMQGEGAFGTTPVPYSKLVNDIKMMMLGYPAPEYIIDLMDGGIIFIDEISSTDVAMQAPLLGIAQARQVGFYKFHPRVRVFAAGNPIELAANGQELAASVANRFGWFDWVPPTAEEWNDYQMLHSGVDDVDEPVQDAKAEEARVMAAWPEAWAKALGYVGSFLVRKGRDMLAKCPKIGDPALHGAWPSHRTWEFGTRALASSYVHGLDKNESEIMVAAFVGGGARDELFHFMDAQDLPDWGAVLDGTVPWKHDPARADVTYVMLETSTALVIPAGAKNRESRAAALYKFIREIDAAGGFDLTEPFGHKLGRAGLHTSDEAVETLTAQRDLLEAAGIKPKPQRRR